MNGPDGGNAVCDPHGRRVTNAATGVTAGSILQAGAIHGGVHIHHAAASAVAVPRELRPAPAHFTGRDRELAELDRIAAAGRERDGPAIAVISGPGGVGKSALALRWMHGVAGRFPDGQLYVDLGSPDSDEPVSLSSVRAHLLRAMGVPGELISADVSEAAALFRSITADKRIALLIENPVSAAQIRTVLPASPASAVVVASRWRLGGLALDGAEFLALEPFQARAGAELLARTVGGSREPDAMASLVELCGGLPIALAIVGARLVMRPGWSLARVVRDLTDERRRLAALSAEQDVSVHGVFDLSYENLAEPLARAYRWLGVHPGPNFSVDVAAALLDSPVSEASDLLETLVDASLLEIGRGGQVSVPRPRPAACPAARADRGLRRRSGGHCPADPGRCRVRVGRARVAALRGNVVAIPSLQVLSGLDCGPPIRNRGGRPVWRSGGEVPDASPPRPHVPQPWPR